MLVIDKKLGVKGSLLRRIQLLEAALAGAPVSVRDQIGLEILELEMELKHVADGR